MYPVQSRIGLLYGHKSLVNLTLFRQVSSVIESKADVGVNLDAEWETALPYKRMPGPSKYELLRGFSPGGKYHDLQIVDMHRAMRRDFGDVVRIPGLLGRADTVLTFKPSIFEKVFRTEGPLPQRRGLETFKYYRKKMRPEVFGETGGLLSEHGEKWLDVRSKVNPVMLQPKTVKMYVEKVDQVACEFLDKVKRIRNTQTMEMPSNFGHELNCWALESIGLIALDQRLGILENAEDVHGRVIIDSVKDFFILAYELDVAVSFWKYYKTPKFYKLMNVFDQMTETIMYYIDKAVARLDAEDRSKINANDRGVLEKLLLIDRQIAIVMAFDMILAGVDTTSAALVSCLWHLAKNPDKQVRLREEVLKYLPSKSTKLTPESLNSMPYMRAVLKEALRISPVLAGNARQTGRNIVLNGYRVPEGTEVAMATVVLQNDPDYFPKTDDFIPERWIKGDPLYDESKMHGNNSFVYLPFGFGPRSCVGRRFAEMEIFILLSRIIREFNIEYHYGPLKYNTSIILAPDEDIKFKFTDTDQ
ncbi:cytochrome P450 CYP12A2-like isoform X2 [Sitodiplosis mosellana]|uniref:cytochrome P450 CYP12A2-like isoform X2 n=1 Tax=Sitodiplosis mosellana TaxID=263140 RepID=UPI0024441652|nr:cytochrome P450 CYP12A2-like isoform X2 [Sitodiplosis mosellana]XP_055324109.1 cytochrome P450 CYP12A2-like isoform X2 [Sitodiplosis mosellana]XP_055324110.1 cytochrome P450 CYP12A2-like isoform X2 [Sitodiplosis mosellana]